jgi:hypothetical protein
VSIEVENFIKGKNESSPRKGGVPSGLPEKWLGLRFLSILSRAYSMSMLIRCIKSSILVGHACNVLIGCALILTLSLFWSVLLSFFLLFKVTGRS